MKEVVRIEHMITMHSLYPTNFSTLLLYELYGMGKENRYFHIETLTLFTAKTEG